MDPPHAQALPAKTTDDWGGVAMIGLADPPQRWDADTAKPGAINTGLAATSEGVEITADVRRHEIRERTQGWLLRADLQESPRPLRTIDIGSLKHCHAFD